MSQGPSQKCLAMQSDNWIALLDLIPTKYHDQLMVVTSVGLEITLQEVLRREPDYLVLRGRVAGTTDTGRIFFIPYDQINFLCVQKSMRISEVREMYGEPPGEDEDTLLTYAEPPPAAQPEEPPAEDLDRTQPLPHLEPPPPPPPPVAVEEPPKSQRLSKAELIARIRSRSQDTNP